LGFVGDGVIVLATWGTGGVIVGGTGAFAAGGVYTGALSWRVLTAAAAAGVEAGVCVTAAPEPGVVPAAGGPVATGGGSAVIIVGREIDADRIGVGCSSSSSSSSYIS
jgi:hypothetical protein